jgi:hypothetical protein
MCEIFKNDSLDTSTINISSQDNHISIMKLMEIQDYLSCI